jgi:hypothetical protein
MAIRTRITIDGTPFSDEISALEALNAIMEEAAIITKNEIEPHWLAEAQHYPPPAKLPFRFATERSRRYYFAVVVKKGFPFRYVRTNKLKDSFFMRFLKRNDAIEFVFGSDSDIAKWVVGSFDQRRQYQVAGHRNTGWPLIAQTATFWLEATEEAFLKRVPDVYAKFNVRKQNR